MTDLEDEKTLAAVAIAPRVTLAEVQANVKHVEYVEQKTFGGQLLRWCVITTQSGFAITGTPNVAVSPANDIPEYGRKAAYESAISGVWQHLGYELKTKLHLIEQAGQPAGRITKLGHGVTTHVGTKVVRAVAMDRGSYSQLRGWQVPANESPLDEGYLVEYTDGGAPNIEGFVGYVSWSPRDVFDRAYGQGLPPKTATHIQRMQEELVTLKTRVVALKMFIGGNNLFPTLAPEEQHDMKEQLKAMEEYSWFLDRRVRRATS